MKEIIEKRIDSLSAEISEIHEEKIRITDRLSELDVKLHQLVGAVYELQKLIESQKSS